MKNSIFVAGLIILFAGISCNSSKITSSWKAQDYTSKNFKQFIVWAIVDEKNPELKIKMENHLTDDLKNAGYNAVSATSIYGAKNFTKEQESEVVAMFKKSGVDALITMVLLSKANEVNYYPPSIDYLPVPEKGVAGRYISTTYEKVYKPGYYTTDTKYFWEGNLYDMANEKLVYSIKTKSFNPYSTDKLAHENGLIMIKDMLKKSIIPNLKPAE